MSVKLFENVKDCTGCGACSQKCPLNAIDLKENEHGFKIAVVDRNKCVECKICVKTCPIINRNNSLLNEVFTPTFYGLRAKNTQTLENSASGGAFTAIVEAIKPELVFGALFDKDFQVVHKCKPMNDISSFRGSKYVQSDTANTFMTTKKALDLGKKVLYTGTPCQIAGLKMFLGKEYENLITCDLVCEGVPSQHFFNQYLDFLRNKFGPIKDISFRCKKYHGWERSDFVIIFTSGKKIIKTCHTKDTFFMNCSMFLGAFRDSCYDCKFNALPRQGDFTIGDLWGWQKMIPQWNDNRGISLVIANSKKASLLIPLLKDTANILKIDQSYAIQNNPNLVRSTFKPACREVFLSDLSNLSFKQLVKKYHKPRSFLRILVSRLMFKLRNK